MLYHLATLLSVILFACVHLLSDKAQKFSSLFHGRLLSMGSGVAIAYVFVDILPKLSESGDIVQQALKGIFPFVERHVYAIALAGFLLFFTLSQSRSFLKENRSFWLSIFSYAFFNFLIGYAIVDKDNPEVKPLALFTFAIGLHFFTNDYTLCKEHGEEYCQKGRWLLVLSLFLGWLAGVGVTIPPAAIALASAFIAGGIIMNVTQHEIPQDNPHSLGSFLLSSFIYTSILLSIGS
jgi:hypothetical protein